MTTETKTGKPQSIVVPMRETSPGELTVTDAARDRLIERIGEVSGMQALATAAKVFSELPSVTSITVTVSNAVEDEYRARFTAEEQTANLYKAAAEALLAHPITDLPIEEKTAEYLGAVEDYLSEHEREDLALALVRGEMIDIDVMELDQKIWDIIEPGPHNEYDL